MRQATQTYLRQQCVTSGVLNAILTSLFFYLSNIDMGVIAYEKVFSDTLITCGFVVCLVTWPTAFFTRKEVRAGLPILVRNPLIDFLPKKWPLLWLTLWLFSVLLVEILTWLGFRVTPKRNPHKHLRLAIRPDPPERFVLPSRRMVPMRSK